MTEPIVPTTDRTAELDECDALAVDPKFRPRRQDLRPVAVATTTRLSSRFTQRPVVGRVAFAVAIALAQVDLAAAFANRTLAINGHEVVVRFRRTNRWGVLTGWRYRVAMFGRVFAYGLSAAVASVVITVVALIFGLPPGWSVWLTGSVMVAAFLPLVLGAAATPGFALALWSLPARWRLARAGHRVVYAYGLSGPKTRDLRVTQLAASVLRQADQAGVTVVATAATDDLVKTYEVLGFQVTSRRGRHLFRPPNPPRYKRLRPQP